MSARTRATNGSSGRLQRAGDPLRLWSERVRVASARRGRAVRGPIYARGALRASRAWLEVLCGAYAAFVLGLAGCQSSGEPLLGDAQVAWDATDSGRDADVQDAAASLSDAGAAPSDASDPSSDAAEHLETVLLTGRLVYEAREPNASWTNWSTLTERPARRVLVRVYRGDSLISQAETSDDPAEAGAFAVQVPAQATDVDRVEFVAAGARGDGALAYAVADPGFHPRAQPHDLFEPKPLARVWSVVRAVRELAPGATLRILEAEGAGAFHVFDAVQRAYAVYAQHASEPLQKVVVWLGLQTRFTCGTCMASEPVETLNATFQHQVWLDGGGDQRYWSEALTLHELGHFVLNALSHPATEGGPHAIGTPTHPGQAFNEGWATFFSSALRASPLYYDKQGSKLFYADLGARRYSEGLPAWQRPEAALGLLQRIDENEVAAMLWDVRAQLGSLEPLLEALRSPRMREPPFARGYTRRVWRDPEDLGQYDDTEDPHAHLADLFDALRCAGALTAAELDAVTQPEQHYPYPSEEPLCGK